MTTNIQTVYRLPATLDQDLETLRGMVGQFEAGTLPAPNFRAFRVPLGVYEQREEGTYMLRVRLPGGAVLPHQMRGLAVIAHRYGSPVLHVTTRQAIQVHSVPLGNIQPALVDLRELGLSTKGGGGNTVRNVMTCADAGVCARELADVTPHAVALTEHLQDDPMNYQLPRKYKIALSGCSEDCGGATVNDLGFVATTRDGEAGFSVWVGGGLGAHCRTADLLEDFVPESAIYDIAEAVKRVFDGHGNRKNRSKARLRYLVEQLGLERFRELYEAELREVRATAPLLRAVGGTRQRASAPAGASEWTSAWRERNVRPQKQPGLFHVVVPLPLGDIHADALVGLADIVDAHGDGVLRASQTQNVSIRGVAEGELRALHDALSALGLAGTPAPVIRNTVSCAGAATCKLGMCLSRGLARALTERLEAEDLDLDEATDLNVHISGCPNSCGQHPIGAIGFFGAARRLDGRLVPHYAVRLGGRLGVGRTRLAEGKQFVPARNIPAFVTELLRAFRSSPEYPDFHAALDAGLRETAATLADRHRGVPAFDVDPSYYHDWGAEAPFSLAGRGPGECGAGVFELIEVDLQSAHEALRDGRLYDATALAARALLVTQGLEARGDADALALFERHFVREGYVDASLGGLVERAQRSAGTQHPAERLGAGEVTALVQAVQHLYDHLDPSLRLRKPERAEAPSDEPQEPACSVGESTPITAGAPLPFDREVDFRGVACPLNYVKTKLVLAQMAEGQVLSVLLDGQGARNVPESAQRDGRTVLSVTPDGDGFRVAIRK